MERTTVFFKEYGLLIVLLCIGVAIIIYGLWGSIVPQRAVVEIVKSGSQRSPALAGQGSELKVDVAGAVEKPGVYTLPSSSRIGDALVMAGGLSATADRGWVSQMLNLAEQLNDGQKIYVPRESENSVTQQTSVSDSQIGRININAASVAELDNLDGIGEARAQAIVANRPYANTEEIVTKAKIPQSVYDKIKDRLTLY